MWSQLPNAHDAAPDRLMFTRAKGLLPKNPRLIVFGSSKPFDRNKDANDLAWPAPTARHAQAIQVIVLHIVTSRKLASQSCAEARPSDIDVPCADDRGPLALAGLASFPGPLTLDARMSANAA